MLKKILYLLIVFTLVTSGGGVNAQEDSKGKFYLPYDLTSHSALKFNTFLMNPALPLLGEEEESNIGIYHRGQWFGFQNNYTSYALAYGTRWNETSAVNGMLYKHDFGVMTNYGLLGNYGHFVELSDQVGLRLGLNLAVGVSGLNKGRVLLPEPGSQTPLDDASYVLLVNTMPGFDMNFGEFHIGLTAENIFDYAISSGGMAVPFANKAFMMHAMYRHELMSVNGLLEDGVLSVMANARKSVNTINVSGSAMLDLPRFGWAYLGYGQNYGIFGGVGFNASIYLSIGVGYEQGIFSKIPNLGGSYQAQINYQFGGRRHERDRALKAKLKLKEIEKKQKEEAAKRAENRPPKEEKPEKPEKPVTPPPVVKTEPEKKEEPKKEKTPMEQLEERIGVRTDRIDDDKVKTGYYVVVGVYRDGRNAFRMRKELEKNGIIALGFVNPANGMTYVHIGGVLSTPHEAEKVMMDNLYNKAFEGIWILKVSR